MVASELAAGLSAFKTMFDMAKALKDINDATIRNTAVIALQEQILAAQVQQAALIGQVGELEEKMRKTETWETEKKRYELKSLGWGAFAYMLKPEMRGSEPPHWVCTNCYDAGRKSIIQYMMINTVGQRQICPACKTQIMPPSGAQDGNGAKWLD